MLRIGDRNSRVLLTVNNQYVAVKALHGVFKVKVIKCLEVCFGMLNIEQLATFLRNILHGSEHLMHHIDCADGRIKQEQTADIVVTGRCGDGRNQSSETLPHEKDIVFVNKRVCRNKVNDGIQIADFRINGHVFHGHGAQRALRAAAEIERIGNAAVSSGEIHPLGLFKNGVSDAYTVAHDDDGIMLCTVKVCRIIKFTEDGLLSVGT